MSAGHFAFDCHTLVHRSLLVIVLLSYFASPAASFFLELSIPLTSPSLIYTPFVCNVTETSLDPNVCQGGWQMLGDSANVTEVLTTGSSKPILPQIFFRFRAAAIYIATSKDSNATVDVVVAWDSVVRRSNFDSSLGFIEIMDLPDNSTLLLTLTVDPSTSPTLFGLTSLEIGTPPDGVIPSILPPPTTPSSAAFPTSFTSLTANQNISTTSSSQSNRNLSRQTIRLAVGLTVGLGMGLPLAAALLYCLCRRRRKSDTKDGRWSFLT